MHKALQVELQDWQRDQEPDTDHEGFYQTSLPTIITQVSNFCMGCRSLCISSRDSDKVSVVNVKTLHSFLAAWQPRSHCSDPHLHCVTIEMCVYVDLSSDFHAPWKMLEENVQVALMIGESLRDQTIQMGLYEMENLLNR